MSIEATHSVDHEFQQSEKLKFQLASADAAAAVVSDYHIPGADEKKVFDPIKQPESKIKNSIDQAADVQDLCVVGQSIKNFESSKLLESTAPTQEFQSALQETQPFGLWPSECTPTQAFEPDTLEVEKKKEENVIDETTGKSDARESDSNDIEKEHERKLDDLNEAETESVAIKSFHAGFLKEENKSEEHVNDENTNFTATQAFEYDIQKKFNAQMEDKNEPALLETQPLGLWPSECTPTQAFEPDVLEVIKKNEENVIDEPSGKSDALESDSNYKEKEHEYKQDNLKEASVRCNVTQSSDAEFPKLDKESGEQVNDENRNYTATEASDQDIQKKLTVEMEEEKEAGSSETHSEPELQLEGSVSNEIQPNVDNILLVTSSNLTTSTEKNAHDVNLNNERHCPAEEKKDQLEPDDTKNFLTPLIPSESHNMPRYQEKRSTDHAPSISELHTSGQSAQIFEPSQVGLHSVNVDRIITTTPETGPDSIIASAKCTPILSSEPQATEEKMKKEDNAKFECEASGQSDEQLADRNFQEIGKKIEDDMNDVASEHVVTHTKETDFVDKEKKEEAVVDCSTTQCLDLESMEDVKEETEEKKDRVCSKISSEHSVEGEVSLSNEVKIIVENNTSVRSSDLGAGNESKIDSVNQNTEQSLIEEKENPLQSENVVKVFTPVVSSEEDKKPVSQTKKSTELTSRSEILAVCQSAKNIWVSTINEQETEDHPMSHKQEIQPAKVLETDPNSEPSESSATQTFEHHDEEMARDVFQKNKQKTLLNEEESRLQGEDILKVSSLVAVAEKEKEQPLSFKSVDSPVIKSNIEEKMESEKNEDICPMPCEALDDKTLKKNSPDFENLSESAAAEVQTATVDIDCNHENFELKRKSPAQTNSGIELDGVKDPQPQEKSKELPGEVDEVMEKVGCTQPEKPSQFDAKVAPLNESNSTFMVTDVEIQPNKASNLASKENVEILAKGPSLDSAELSMFEDCQIVQPENKKKLDSFKGEEISSPEKIQEEVDGKIIEEDDESVAFKNEKQEISRKDDTAGLKAAKVLNEPGANQAEASIISSKSLEDRMDGSESGIATNFVSESLRSSSEAPDMEAKSQGKKFATGDASGAVSQLEVQSSERKADTYVTDTKTELCDKNDIDKNVDEIKVSTETSKISQEFQHQFANKDTETLRWAMPEVLKNEVPIDTENRKIGKVEEKDVNELSDKNTIIVKDEGKKKEIQSKQKVTKKKSKSKTKRKVFRRPLSQRIISKKKARKKVARSQQANRKKSVPQSARGKKRKLSLGGKSGTTRSKKRVRTFSKPYILRTGYNYPAQDKSLRKIGAKILSTVDSKVTHLCIDRFMTTEKLICGLAYCNHLVASKWLTRCIKERNFEDEEKFKVSNGVALRKIQRELDFKISEFMERRNAKKNKLFHGKKLYMTKNVDSSVGNMFIAHGGKLSNSPGRKYRTDVIVLGLNESDEEAQKLIRKKFRVRSPTWVKAAILRQRIPLVSEFRMEVNN